jgi:hypothetical protein
MQKVAKGGFTFPATPDSSIESMVGIHNRFPCESQTHLVESRRPKALEASHTSLDVSVFEF